MKLVRSSQGDWIDAPGHRKKPVLDADDLGEPGRHSSMWFSRQTGTLPTRSGRNDPLGCIKKVTERALTDYSTSSD